MNTEMESKSLVLYDRDIREPLFDYLEDAALGIILGLNGVAAGAATIGCCCQMIGFAVTSFKDNGVGGLFAQGIGTSMLHILL